VLALLAAEQLEAWTVIPPSDVSADWADLVDNGAEL